MIISLYYDYNYTNHTLILCVCYSEKVIRSNLPQLKTFSFSALLHLVAIYERARQIITLAPD